MPTGDTEIIIAWKSKRLSVESIKPANIPGNIVSRTKLALWFKNSSQN